MAMHSERLQRIEELYHLVGERPPDEREPLLAEACANDTELLRDVLALLAQDSESGPMERPVLELAAELLADPPGAQWTAGTQVGPYRIVSRLGEGGMGDVFKARDTRLGREVAIKMAHKEFSGRFLREARAISALNHPNICTLYDVGPDYLVMEFVEGETLASRLAKGCLSMDLALRYGTQIADALAAAHAKGITHRDLKPANIMVTKAGIHNAGFRAGEDGGYRRRPAE
jgi:serine/threonine protein kinase